MGNSVNIYDTQSQKWEWYIDGVKVMEVDRNGNIKCKGEFSVLQTL
jgi:hypothetical protein